MITLTLARDVLRLFGSTVLTAAVAVESLVIVVPHTHAPELSSCSSEVCGEVRHGSPIDERLHRLVEPSATKPCLACSAHGLVFSEAGVRPVVFAAATVMARRATIALPDASLRRDEPAVRGPPATA